MQQIQLAMFFVAVAALVVTGCILTGKLRKRPVVRDEHQPGCFALEEERGGSWKGSRGTVPSVKEAKPRKKLNQGCDPTASLRRNEAWRIAAGITKLPDLMQWLSKRAH
jgi:hypothetical protein